VHKGWPALDPLRRQRPAERSLLQRDHMQLLRPEHRCRFWREAWRIGLVSGALMYDFCLLGWDRGPVNVPLVPISGEEYRGESGKDMGREVERKERGWKASARALRLRRKRRQWS
jgi:hypothetical protein